MTLPSTLRQGNSTGDWNTTPMSRLGPLIGMPLRSASPSVWGSRPASTLSRVDLPQPEGPTTTMNSLSATLKEMLLSARTPLSPRPYLSDSRRTEITPSAEVLGKSGSSFASKRRAPFDSFFGGGAMTRQLVWAKVSSGTEGRVQTSIFGSPTAPYHELRVRARQGERRRQLAASSLRRFWFCRSREALTGLA